MQYLVSPIKASDVFSVCVLGIKLLLGIRWVGSLLYPLPPQPGIALLLGMMHSFELMTDGFLLFPLSPTKCSNSLFLRLQTAFPPFALRG